MSEIPEIDATKNPPDREYKCHCGARILVWQKDKRIAHSIPECEPFARMCEGLKSHKLEGQTIVIEKA